MNLPPMSDYDELRRDFDWQLPDTFNFGRDVVDDWAARTTADALIAVDREGRSERSSFVSVSSKTSQIANLLVRLGVARGDRVLVMLPRIAEWHLAVVGCLKLGAVVVPCVDMLTTKDVAFRVRHADVRAVITTNADIGKFGTLEASCIRLAVGPLVDGWTSFDDHAAEPSTFACADLALEEPAVLYYTSGSSGQPKGVLHPTRSLYAWRGSATYWQALRPGDIKWCTSDTGWSKAGTGILFGPWTMGATVLLYNGPFDARRRLELIRAQGVTVFCATATEYRHLVQLPPDAFAGTRLRLALSAGEAVGPDIVERWRASSGVPLLDGYGQTETLLNIVNYPTLPVRPGSMGKPLPGTTSRVIDADGNECAPFERGRLVMELPSPTFMSGYWKDPAATERAMLRVGDRRYWVTGDLAYADDDGYLFYSGRDDDIIGSAGYRIGPVEVENALMTHPAVLESAVVGSPDALRGEVVKAFVVLNQGHAASDALAVALQEHVKAATAPYKYPRRVEFVTELPRNITGKVLRRVLRDREAARADATVSAGSASVG